MKKYKALAALVYTVYTFLLFSGSVYAIGERIISLGGDAAWRSAGLKSGVTEVSSVRPYPVLMLSSSASTVGYSAAAGVWGNMSARNTPAPDMSVSFDEGSPDLFKDITGNYRLSVTPFIESTDRSLARAGDGAVLFGAGPVTIEPKNNSALFSSGSRIRDFTIEFWLYPLNMENGEKIISWSAYNVPHQGSASSAGINSIQRINCYTSRNRLTWSFVNFFTSINGLSYKNIEFSGNTPLIPKTWSHHLVRFDAATGMIEYLVNGAGEAILYATATNRESSEVYTPVAGSDGVFLLGEQYSGVMDEFKIFSSFAGRSSLEKYPLSGGRMETSAVDLGDSLSSVIRIDATGGRTGSSAALSEYRENGRFRFSDNSEINFFIRAGNNPWLMQNSRWVSFTPGENISGIQGRYVQIAADFYPSSDGETSPYLDALKIIYMPGEPPLPPRGLTAAATDGAVTLRWRHSPTGNISGYLVYYSDVRGEFFGTASAMGPSPIDVGITDNVYIGGLTNGTLYYFAVAAYDNRAGGENFHAGEFSSEAAARPLAGLGR